MVVNLDEYKAKLRKRNVSQLGDHEMQEKELHSSRESLHELNVSPKLTTEEISLTEPIPKRSEVHPSIVEIPVIEMKDFEVVEMDDKLNLLMSAINKVNTNFYMKFESLEKQLSDTKDSLVPRISAAKSAQEELDARVDDLEGKITKVDAIKVTLKSLQDEHAQLYDELAVVKGILQVHDRSIHNNKNKIVDLTARSMSMNILISGIEGDPATKMAAEGKVEVENCKEKVIEFMKTKLKMEDLKDEEIIVAHRTGRTKNNKPRVMVVRCAQDLRSRIFKFTRNLKDATNSAGDSFYVNAQLPEPMLTEKREREDRLRSIRKANDQIPEEEKHRKTVSTIKNNTLYINKEPQRKHIHPPTVQNIFNCNREMGSVMGKVKLVHSAESIDKYSRFIGHTARVNNVTEINAAYRKIRLLYPESDHIMMAYGYRSFTGFHDDGEHVAGNRLMQILLQRGSKNTAVFVTREYGGVQLGQRRFLHIEKSARDALDALSMEG